MALSGENILLRIYLRTGDRAPLTPSYERLVKAARASGLAGATVLEGILGFGSHGIAEFKPFALVEHVPVILEIVDAAERIEAFLAGPMQQEMMAGLATLERANVMMYRRRSGDERRKIVLADRVSPLSSAVQIQPKGRMTINDDGILLRVFIGDSDRHDGKPLYQAIINTARQLGLAGATVLPGTEGFGANSVVHKAALLEMSTDLPILIEIVDRRDKIELLVPHLEKMVDEGMITMEYVAMVMYRHNPADAPKQ